MSINRFIKYVNGIMPNLKLEYDFADKPRATSQHIRYMINRTQSMFKWEGLPETIPERFLELYLQLNGHVCITKVNDNLYAFAGGVGGEPDPYYMPTIYTVANPALNYSAHLKIGSECILLQNDSLFEGLIPLFTKYATAMSEVELSLDIAAVNSRIINLITAPDDDTFESAKKYLADIRDGKQGIIAENAFLDGIRSQPYGANGSHQILTNLIELEQYYKASWYNDIGLNANYNMKRESINSGESQLNNDALLPLVDNMLSMRKLGAEAVNNLYGTKISVDYNSSWRDNIEEIEKELENLGDNGNSSNNNDNNDGEGGEPNVD